MEAVGIVLGAIPLVMSALQSYKDAKKLGGLFLNRKKHVGKLIRALREQHGALKTNIVWLLKAIDEPDCDIQVGSYFEDADIRSKMIDYLGDPGFDHQDSLWRGLWIQVPKKLEAIDEGGTCGGRDPMDGLQAVTHLTKQDYQNPEK